MKAKTVGTIALLIFLPGALPVAAVVIAVRAYRRFRARRVVEVELRNLGVNTANQPRGQA